jgi:two-component system, OmpR family, phosphate regulon response regulator PhoB
MSKILLVDDAKDIHMILNAVFDEDQIIVSAFDLKHATQLLEKEVFDLILLDIVLPDGDGLEFCAKLRAQSSTKDIPVIFLSGKSDLSAKSIGFSLGAEDYIVKPFEPLEVKLRCTAKLKKYEVKKYKETQFKIGDLRFEIPSQRVFLKNDLTEELLNLTPTGFKLLLYLARNESQVLSREQIINAVWGAGTFIVDRTVDTHVGSIRKRLTTANLSIQSVHGQGYKLHLISNKDKKTSAA